MPSAAQPVSTFLFYLGEEANNVLLSTNIMFSFVHTSIGLNLTNWQDRSIGFPLPHIETGYFIF